MKNKTIALAAILLLSSNAIADTGYVCIADHVSGFHHNADRDTWEQATFLPGERFLISEIRQDIYKVETTDEHNGWSAICTLRPDQTDDSFTCEKGTTELHFNRREMRFTSFRYFGFWNGSNDSLSITIGKCFPM